MRRFYSPEFVALCFSPEGWQKIAGGKQRAATGNVIQWDSTPSGGGRKREAAGGATSGTPFGVRVAVLPQVPVVARAYHRLFSGTPMRGAGRGCGVFAALSLWLCGCQMRPDPVLPFTQKHKIAGIASESQSTENQSTEAQCSQSPNRRGTTRERNTTPTPNEIRRSSNGTPECSRSGVHYERGTERCARSRLAQLAQTLTSSPRGPSMSLRSIPRTNHCTIPKHCRACRTARRALPASGLPDAHTFRRCPTRFHETTRICRVQLHYPRN